MNIKDPSELWKTTLAQIEIKLDAPAQFRTFFQDTKLIRLDGKKAVIGVPNPYTSEWLKARHEGLIKETISYVYGEQLVPAFEIYTREIEPEVEIKREEMPLLDVENGIMSSVIDTISQSGLNTRYSMTNYVVGSPNKIAHAASLAVIDKPGQIYNPLFVHGKTGVGKTHLAQAIGRSILERDLRKKIIYTSSEGFLNDMVMAIKTGKQDKFRAKYRPVDVLIIDDMQLISKWIHTQVEFFNTFNELYNAGKQIIFIADRRPEDMKDVEDRLRSRMQGGMVVSVGQPDYEMRLAIVQKKNEESGLGLNNNILEFVARSVNDNVRALEGALQKVALFNQMKPDGDLSLEEVAHTIGKDSKTKQEQVRVPKIVKEVAKAFNSSVKDLKGPKRTKDLALARQVAMFILREEFDYKLEEVAKFLNRKDHTTVLHAVDKIKSKMMIQDEFNHQVVKIINNIHEGEAVEE